MAVSYGYSQELLINGNFENGGTGWYNNAFNPVDDGSGNFVNEANVLTAGNPWDVNMSQDVTLTAGLIYQLSFDAYTDAATGSRDILAGIGQNVPDWDSNVITQTITTTKTNYSFQLEANYILPVGSRVIFDLGAAAGFVFLDNVSLTEVVATPTCTDGIQNGDEAGIDCGGSCPNACPAGISLSIDFESVLTWNNFDGGATTHIANPQSNVDNNSANVGQMVKSAGQTWGGSSLLLTSPMDFANNNTFTMKAYTIKAFTKILLKVEDSSDPQNLFFEQEVVMTSTNAWEELTFNYSSIDQINSYDTLVIIFDNGTEGDGSANFTFLMDDITLTNEAPPPACSTGGSTGAVPGVNYELVWADEFDIDGPPCSENWGYDIGAGGWGNGEAQYYTNSTENASVNNGVLTIKAKKENLNGSQYTSARLLTKNRYEFTYGKVDIRAKLPTENGTWSALWMLGANFPNTPWPAAGEIDIMEHTGNNENVTLGTVHNTSGSGGSGAGSHIAMPTPTEYHNYSIEWNKEKIDFLVDEVVFFTYSPDPKTSDNYPYNSDFFLIMNIAMGGTLGQGIDPLFTEATMEIDYVRVYQKTQPLTEPIASAPSPTIIEDNVLSTFSDAYPTNRVSNFDFLDFNGTGNYTIIEIESNGNETGKMENLSFYGAKWDAVDVTPYTHVHFDYWTYDSKAINFFLIDQTAGFGGGEPQEPRYSILDSGGDETIVYSQWQSVFIPLQHFLDFNSGSFNYDLNDIHQYKFDGSGTIYFDNIYFTNNPSLSTNQFKSEKFISYPNPAHQYWNVKSSNQDIQVIYVFDIFGKVVKQLNTKAKEIKLDVSDLQTGVYFAKIIAGKGSQNLKFIKN